MKYKLRIFHGDVEKLYIPSATVPPRPRIRLTDGITDLYFALSREKTAQNEFCIVNTNEYIPYSLYIDKQHTIPQLAQKKHPLMTGYTTNGYTVSASAEANSGWLSWYAFDGRTDRGWATGQNANSTITLSCPTAECLHKVVVNAKLSGSDTEMTTIKIEGQLEDNTWVTLIDNFPSLKTADTFEIPIPYTEQRKFKSFRATANHTNHYGGFMELQYYTYLL